MPGPLMLLKLLTIALATMLFCSFVTVSNSADIRSNDYTRARDLVARGDCEEAWELIRKSFIAKPENLNKFLTFAFSNGFRVYPSMEDNRDFVEFLVAVSLLSFENLDAGATQVVDAALYDMLDDKSRRAFIECTSQGLPCREAAFFSLRRQPAGEYLKEFVGSMLDEDSYGFCPSGLGIRRMQ